MEEKATPPLKKPKNSRKRNHSSEYEASMGEEGSSAEDATVETDASFSEETVAEPVRRKREAPEFMPNEKYGAFSFKNDNTSGYMPYVPGRWTAQSLYRLPADVILNTIRKNGTEGIGRYELGQVLGYDSTVKTGGRRVTNHIVNVTNDHPDHIGQFQKMNGKVRTIRYYWKESDQPEKFEELLQEFERLSGRKCPFQVGDVIKFPEKKLNTLRISDVTLKRLNMLLSMVNEHRVIVTINRVVKMIGDAEAAVGYKFQIDKKSALKCLYALKSKGFISVWDTTVRSENLDYQIQVVGHGTIEKVDDPEVFNAIGAILDAYHKEGRVFPHGQFRTFKKLEKPDVSEFDQKVEDIDDDMTKPRTIKDRYHFFRVQTVRNSWKGKNLADVEGELLDETAKEGVEDVSLDDTEENPNQAMVDLFSKNTSSPQKRSTLYYFGRESLGYQPKAIRLLIIHEMVHHFLYGSENADDSSVFNIFPPTRDFESWPVKDEYSADVFVDEDSPYRFMPFQPKYDGVERGWFMMQDFLAAMPLSVFVLTNFVPKTISRSYILSFLEHPIRRHLCIGYLPTDIRNTLMKDKKIHRQLEHIFLFLGAMGLTAIGPNPSTRRFPGCITSMLYLARRAELFDTSNSAKGYACVDPPVDSGTYPKYEYEFHTRNDVNLYWHHLRAIVQSTPLSHRVAECGDPKFAARHKQYSVGVFDKKLLEIEHEQVSDKLAPFTLHDGVAGFDSALFLHLKRHWDLLTVPHAAVHWFVRHFRRCSDLVRTSIESKVQVLQKDWNSFVRLSLTEVDPGSRMGNVLKVECPTKVLKKFNCLNKPANLAKKTAIDKNPKKRKPDIVDLVSASSRVSVRCRFSPKERDQLIMIRAVGFFLNPVYRFWLDPTVLRDLMHEFVPESRNKTVQSLMACGVRELVRTNRLAYLQRVVRNLSTFPEMRRLRAELCSAPVSQTESKTDFFKYAFRTAMKLLFVDNDRIPHTSISDDSFKEFLSKVDVSVTKETTMSNSSPLRSQKPQTAEHIQHCVTSNVLLSVLIHSRNGEFAEKVLEQVPPSVLQAVLQALKTDGLVARSRIAEAASEFTNKNLATLSYYFRHFFSHRFHSDLVEGSGRLLQEMNDEMSADSIELGGDLPEVVVAAASTFYGTKFSLDMNVDDDVLEAFTKMDQDQTIKKIRYLESADLHFEKVHVVLDKVGDSVEHEPNLAQVVSFLDRSRPILEIEDFYVWVEQFPTPTITHLHNIMEALKNSKAIGLTLSEICHAVTLPADTVLPLLMDLNDTQQVLACGVDEHRWVSIEFEHVWTIGINGRKWCPRLWISPEGAISLPVVRWIAESTLLTIVGKPGILLKDVLFTYEFVLQPVSVQEIIDLLEHFKCIVVMRKEFASSKLASPFGGSVATETVTYVNPTVDALERFSRIFHTVELLPSMTPKN